MWVESCKRKRKIGEKILRNEDKYVDIEKKERRFGKDEKWMIGWIKKLENLKNDEKFIIEWMIRIGIGENGDCIWMIEGNGKIELKKERRVRIGEEEGLKIEKGGKENIDMGGKGEKIDEEMLEEEIGIDGEVEGNIERIIECDDGERIIDM